MKPIKLTVISILITLSLLCGVFPVSGNSLQDPPQEPRQEPEKPEKEEKQEAPKPPAATETEEKILALGFKVFDDNCSGCHDGGENVIVEEKSLKKEALAENGFNGPEDIKKIVLSGKSIMPSFKESLSEEEIQALAAYVWAQSQKDWK